MRQMTRRLTGAVAAMVAAFATPAMAGDDVQLWATVAADAGIGDNTDLTLDLISRSRPDSIDTGQIFVRVGARHRVDEAIAAQVTYAWVRGVVDGGSDTTEHRVSETVSYRFPSRGAWAFDARAGLEQRFQATGGEIGWRARERVRVIRALAPSFDAQASHELIFALNDTAWGQASGLTASRVSGALHVAINPHLGLAPGYSWQHLFRRNADDRNDHIVQMTVDAHF